MNVSPEILKAIAVTAELTGTTFTEPAVRVLADDLSQFSPAQVFASLRRCRRELRSTLTLAAIIERIDDGRPGPEEAWAICASAINDERITLCWTEEMKTAFFVARGLADNPVAARMAFLERYRTALMQARTDNIPAKWTMCLGHDAQGRESAILQAKEQGKITDKQARVLLPYLPIENAEHLNPLTENLLQPHNRAHG